MSLEERPLCCALGCPVVIESYQIMCKLHLGAIPSGIMGRIYACHRPSGFEPSPQYVTEVRKAIVHVARAEGRLVDASILLEKLYSTESDRMAYLISSQPLLGGRVPVELMRNPKGMRTVLDQLQAAVDGVIL